MAQTCKPGYGEKILAEVVWSDFGPQGLVGKHTDCLEGSRREKDHGGHGMKKVVVVIIMKARHKVLSWEPWVSKGK